MQSQRPAYAPQDALPLLLEGPPAPRDPGVRLRDIAATVGIGERSAFGIVNDLVAAGYTVKEKGGRRNRYRVVAHLPAPEPACRHLAIGDLLALLG
jgi:hypothetical protein